MKVNYPNDFDQNNGVEVDDETVNRWIADCIERLKPRNYGEYTMISSGNTRVDVVKLNPAYEGYEYEITVSKNYKSLSI